MMEKPKVILTVGLPLSGKSTWAREQGHPIVNPDSIRLALHGMRFVPAAEDFVWAITYLMVRALILAGHEKVIVDATNITSKRRQPYYYKFKDCIIDCHEMGTSKEECIKRAKDLGDEEIIPVIERMAADYDYDRHS